MGAHKLKGLKAAAVALLAVAIALLVLALTSSQQAASIQGPSALLGLDDAQVWIGVDDELWRVSHDGRVEDRRPVGRTGLPGAPSQLVRHPDGSVVATVRDDATLYFLDPRELRVTRRVAPRWPAELAKHGARAITIAFDASGRIAIATGGGHAVALFDADGGFIARTTDGLYKFTNGLWWHGQDLWTTDTNRFQLKRLDGMTLALRETRTLPADARGGFLGPARAMASTEPASVALVRYDQQMIVGQIVSVDAGGGEGRFKMPSPDAEPRDLDWLRGELLASDGASLAVWRWSAPGAAPVMFGDDALRAEWSALSTRRAALQARYRTALGAAIAVFCVAFALAVWAEKLGSEATPGRAAVDLSRLGTPLLTRRELATLQFKAWGWMLAIPLLLLVLSSGTVVSALRQLGGRALLIATMIALPVVVVVIGVVCFRRLKRLAADEALEPVFNDMAVRRLRRSKTVATWLQPDEHVLETFSWMLPTLHWVVLTDRRVLIFTANLFDARLKQSIARADVTAASTTRGALKPRGVARRLLLDRPQFAAIGGWLELRTRDGEALTGAVAAATVAGRVAQHLQLQRDVAATAAAPSAPALPLHAQPLRREPSAMAAAIASALVPGLGQWMQRRRATALLMFVPWALAVVVLFVPVAWALSGPRTEVSTSLIVAALGLALLDAAVAAWDAWRMAPASAR
ncbi:MAG TPA: hypothetical protein VNU71_05310 [Burkholderiaceae bacterium]|nr:hypothetical protein [Burkholderiaceae bacterium]